MLQVYDHLTSASSLRAGVAGGWEGGHRIQDTGSMSKAKLALLDLVSGIW